MVAIELDDRRFTNTVRAVVVPSSSERMQSITVSTRLRSADRPATWGAARGTGMERVQLDDCLDGRRGQRNALPRQ